MDVKTLPGVECTRFNVSVLPSTIKHPSAELGMFMNRAVGDQIIIDYDHGSIAYTMVDQESTTEMHGDGIMEEGKAEFRN